MRTNHRSMSRRLHPPGGCRPESIVITNVDCHLRKGQSGFTVIELPAAVSIIACLVALLLPAVQKVREAANRRGCLGDLQQISAAEGAYFTAHQAFGRTLDDLGLANQFPNGEKDGYQFNISFPNNDPSRVRLLGSPVAPGKTGLTDEAVSLNFTKIEVDHKEQSRSAPHPGAAAFQRQMFANLRALAAQAMAGLVNQAPDHFDQFAAALTSPQALSEAFSQFDTNDDGLVTLNELMNTNNFDTSINGGGAFSQLLPALGQELALGAGGEDVANLPGVSLEKLKLQNVISMGVRPPSAGAQDLQWSISGGISQLLMNTSPNGSSLPAVQIAGFANGGLQPFSHGGGAIPLPALWSEAQLDPQITGDGGGTWTVDLLSFHALLSPPAPPQNPSILDTLGGTFTLTTGDGASLGGILVAVSPSTQTSPPAILGTGDNRGVNLGASTTAANSPTAYRALVIVSGDTVFLAGHRFWKFEVAERGQASIDWGDTFGDTVQAAFHVAPW